MLGSAGFGAAAIYTARVVGWASVVYRLCKASQSRPLLPLFSGLGSQTKGVSTRLLEFLASVGLARFDLQI